jgi:hypothetical protein
VVLTSTDRCGNEDFAEVAAEIDEDKPTRLSDTLEMIPRRPILIVSSELVESGDKRSSVTRPLIRAVKTRRLR